jgi:glutamine synthetase
MTPADPDMLAMPLAESAIQLPWKPEVAWLTSELVMNGKPVEQAPRRVLARQAQRAAEYGYTMKSGVECEFFLLHANGQALSDANDTHSKPCYDQLALMRRYDVIKTICDAMLELGWGPYQNDHEDANGQFELNWTYADALTTADRHSFFKYMVKTIAEQHGMRATFMPKPFAQLSGNGCHTHVSLWSNDRNVFCDKSGELGLSRVAYQFLGGVLQHAPALCAITNPTVNSYKRIHGATTHSGATWSPNTISYSGNNRTHMIRIPDCDRFELRLADGSSNPYLLQAAVLAAGLDGIAQQRDPGPRRDNNMYAESLPDVGTLPSNLLDSLRALRSSESMRAALSPAFVDAYCKLKEREWHEQQAQISAWEREATLDC